MNLIKKPNASFSAKTIAPSSKAESRPYAENVLVRRYGYIDALRGYAILSVIAHHAAQRIPTLGGPLRLLAESGAMGVQLFFVVSALTLTASWHKRNDGAAPFLVRRLFRIAPMFWLAIPFYSMLWGFSPGQWAPDGISAWQVILTASFLHGWHPASINSVVPGGWSIAVETTFYAMFPLLVVTLRSLGRTVLALAAAVVIAKLVNPHVQDLVAVLTGEPTYLNKFFIYFYIINQLPVFLIGMMVFFCLKNTSHIPFPLLYGGIVASVTFIVARSFVDYIPHVPVAGHIQFALGFGVLTFCLAKGAGSWIANLPMRLLGKISFSAYLWHFAMLDLFFLALQRLANLGLPQPTDESFLFLISWGGVTLITAGVSALSYNFVERPMIELGSKLARSPTMRSKVRSPLCACCAKP